MFGSTRCALVLCIATVIAGPSLGDAKGNAILKEAFTKYGAAKTMTAAITINQKDPRTGAPITLKGTVVAMKPNYLRMEVSLGENAQSFVADGKQYFSYVSAGSVKAYRKEPDQAKPVEYQGIWEGEIDSFFGGAASAAKYDAMLTGSEKVGGVECDLVKVEMKVPERTAVYAIGKLDKLIHRASLTIPVQGGAQQSQTNLLSDIKFNVAKTPADFVFKIPPGAKEVPAPKPPVISI